MAQSGSTKGRTIANVNMIDRSGSDRITSMTNAMVLAIQGSSERRNRAKMIASGMPRRQTAAKMNTVSDSPPQSRSVTSVRPKTPPRIRTKKVANPRTQRMGRRLALQKAGMQDRTATASMTRHASAERHCSSNG